MPGSSGFRSLALLGLLLSLLPFGLTQSLSARTPLAADDSTSVYIIQLRGDPLATSPGVPPRSDKAGPRSDAKPDLNSPQAQARESQLDAQQRNALVSFNQVLGSQVTPLYTYTIAFNGMALELTATQAQALAKLPDVVSVEREQIYELTSDAGPQWIGADQVWSGSVTGVYAATILGSNEVPAVESPASGRGTFSFDSGRWPRQLVEW